ncbi:hypothetical protein JL722_3713 [Aureococcus anophagefferens]|nr:hypothetical protein JL722_3713 [Aureococcus anophagefferens]
MADFDAVPSPDTSRAPGVRAFGSPDAPASSFDVSREALAAKAFSAGAVFGAGANPRDEAPACRVGDAAERRLAAAARLAKDSGPPVRPPVPAPLGGRPSDSLGRRPVSRADALDTVHNLDDMLMAALAASRPWATFVDALEERAPACVDLAIGVAASLELRMDLMDVVLELSRTWLAGDRLGERFYTSLARSVPKLRDLSLAERTECDATVMSVGEVSGPSAYARVADDVVRRALKRQTHRRLGALAGGAGGALVGTARVAAAARAVQDTLVLEPAWARFVDAEDAFRAFAGRCDDVVLEALAGAAPRDVRVAAAKAARKVVVAPRGAILDAARGAHAASVSWLKSHEREAAAAYSEDEDEDVGFATPRASAPGSPVLTPLLASPGAYLAEALGALRTPGREAASPLGLVYEARCPSEDWSPPSLAVFLSLGTSSRRMVVGDRDVALASPGASARGADFGAGSFGAGSFADFLLDDGSLMPCDDISLAPRVFLDTVAVTQSTQDETQEADDDDDDDARVHTPVAPPSDARRARRRRSASRGSRRGASRTARARAAPAGRRRRRRRARAAAPPKTLPHGFPIDIFHRTNPVVPYKNRSVVPKESAQFPTKLRALLEEPKHADVVVWRASTQSICVLDKPAFCKILPRYFKLSYKTGAAAADLKKMWDSFVRQLNYYGFHKRTRGADEYAITDDPKITSPRKFSRLCRRLPISRAKDRPSISDLDRAALPAPRARAAPRARHFLHANLKARGIW